MNTVWSYLYRVPIIKLRFLSFSPPFYNLLHELEAGTLNITSLLCHLAHWDSASRKHWRREKGFVSVVFGGFPVYFSWVPSASSPECGSVFRWLQLHAAYSFANACRSDPIWPALRSQHQPARTSFSETGVPAPEAPSCDFRDTNSSCDPPHLGWHQLPEHQVVYDNFGHPKCDSVSQCYSL